jgi:hypothetical protein
LERWDEEFGMGDTLVEKLKAAPQQVYPQHLLATFPRIAGCIAGLWGHREIEAYFQDLMIDDRGNRQGFPPEVLMEILALRTYHRSLFPPSVRTVHTWADLVDKDEAVAQAVAVARQTLELRLEAQASEPPRAREM